MKKRIGIITFHRAINYGAVLQAYALQKYISQIAECEIIDYNCRKIMKDYKVVNYKNPKKIVESILKLPYTISKKKKFNIFINKNIKLSKEYDANTISNSNDNYDEFITGSDQVWNYELTGEDDNYFLKFVNDNSKKNSFSASVGNLKSFENTINNNKMLLEKYNHISVREKDVSTFLIEKKNISNIVTIDPVFLLDNKDWVNISKNIKRKNFVFVYCLHENSIYEIAEKIAKLSGLEIVCFSNSFKRPIRAKYIMNAGIEEFLGYINNSSYVITDSFHGTVLSIILRKNVKPVLKTEKKHLNSRIVFILELLGMKDIVVDKNSSNSELLKTTDYSNIENKINNMIKGSKDYLDKIVGGERKNEK